MLWIFLYSVDMDWLVSEKYELFNFLVDNYPGREFIELARNMSREEMSDVDLFVYDIYVFDSIFERAVIVKGLADSKTWISELDSDVGMFRKTIDEFNNYTDSFNKILEVILAIGNYLNRGSNKGNCDGFTLDTLLKLNDFKTSSNTSTLMNYIVEFISRSEFSHVLDFSDLAHLLSKYKKFDPEEAGRKLSVLNTKLSSSFSNISDITSTRANDNFLTKIPAVFESYQETIHDIKNILDSSNEEYQRILHLYLATDNEFFSIIKSFASSIKTCKDHLYLSTESN